MTEAEAVQAVIELLKGGHAMDLAGREALISELPDEKRSALYDIATGQRDVEHPQLRLKAVTALGFDRAQSAAALEALRSVLKSGEAAVRIHALRAMGRLDPADVAADARAIVIDPEARPDVALAAAWVAARSKADGVGAELEALRQRLLPLVPGPESPSIRSLDRLIRIANGEEDAPPQEEPKLEI